MELFHEIHIHNPRGHLLVRIGKATIEQRLLLEKNGTDAHDKQETHGVAGRYGDRRMSCDRSRLSTATYLGSDTTRRIGASRQAILTAVSNPRSFANGIRQ